MLRFSANSNLFNLNYPPLYTSVPGKQYLFNPSVADEHMLVRVTEPRVEQSPTSFLVQNGIMNLGRKAAAALDNLTGFGLYGHMVKFRRKHLSNVSAETTSRIAYTTIDNDGDPNQPLKPFITPDEDALRQFPQGYEDPRISRVGDDYYILHSLANYKDISVNRDKRKPINGVRIGLARTKDFKAIDYVGEIGPNCHNRNAGFLPKLIKNADGDPSLGLLLKRNPGIGIAHLPKDIEKLQDPKFRSDLWKKVYSQDNTIIAPRHEWESDHISLSQSPIELDDGWLVVFHGVDKKKQYQAGMAILDKDDPKKVKHRLPIPVIESDADNTKTCNSLVPNIILPSGGRVIEGEEGKKLQLFYGKNDCEVCKADADLEEVTAALKKYDGKGKKIPKASKKK